MEKLLSFLALSSLPYSDEIKTKLLHLLYSNFLRASAVIIAVSSFMTVTLWATENHTILMGWYLSLVFITLFRIVDTRIYMKDKDQHPYRYWQQHFMLGVIVSALLWAAVPSLFFHFSDHQTNFFIAFVILGMTAGASTTLAANLRLMHIYLYLLLIPMLYAFLQFEGSTYTAAAMMTIIFIPLVSVTARQFHATLVETYHTLELYTETKEELTANEKRLSMMFEQAPVGIFYYDNDLNILECNTALTEILHAPKEQLVGLNLHNLPDPRPLDGMRQFLDGKSTAVYEGPYNSINGLELSVKIQMTPLRNESDNDLVRGGLCMFEDKTTEHSALKEAEFLSLHDHLTGLPNRKLLKERMQQTLAEQEREGTYSALLFLDLDHFKQINDSLGHVVGDKILIETAQRLTQTLRKSDTLSRLGGDEFVILLPQLSHTQDDAIRHAYDVAQKIHTMMDKAFTVEKQLLFTSTSIGISLFNAQLNDNDEILRRADMAMYQSKAEGRKCTRFYDKTMDQEMQAYIEMKKNLRNAIEHQEFSLHFQPILSIDSKRVVAAETLLRWKHDGQLVSTIDFITIAEESSLITEIGHWVIEQTCKQVRNWRDAGQFSLEYVTINISARQLLEDGFCDFLLQTVAQYCLEHRVLKLEITETALIANFDKAKKVIDTLNAIGIDFIIDDFGTGYSSLSYLKSFPFSALKIDRSFVKDILTDPEDEKLIRAIIHTAEQFNYQIIAEGIEEEAQRVLLEEINPEIYYQGYLAAKPLNAEAFMEYLKSN